MTAFRSEEHHRFANSRRERNFNLDSRTNNLTISWLVQPLAVISAILYNGSHYFMRLGV